MTAERRPTGITVLAILWVIAGVLWIFSLLTIDGAFGLVSVGIVALLLAMAYGTWTLKPWAWIAGIVLAILNLFIASQPLSVTRHSSSARSRRSPSAR